MGALLVKGFKARRGPGEHVGVSGRGEEAAEGETLESEIPPCCIFPCIIGAYKRESYSWLDA